MKARMGGLATAAVAAALVTGCGSDDGGSTAGTAPLPTLDAVATCLKQGGATTVEKLPAQGSMMYDNVTALMADGSFVRIALTDDRQETEELLEAPGNKGAAVFAVNDGRAFVLASGDKKDQEYAKECAES